ncbi:haloacid dehalogenase type II [Pontixanthobacter gangjinensis]|uniref:Haloacid dehalogenase type II n=1 Tax=Christiangramia aestuarii TaxID=1028746 RepID=A0A7K1LSA1_9FLAO|nr:haloacid dehalogenase type II [Christiangramia aestuarii]MUP43699.1 haloacid dehalogenase type II [Christiangramia aestuarii]
MRNRPETLIFDVNETLLDLEPIKKSINKALKDDGAAEIWFSQLLHYSLVESITGTYHDFSKIAAAVFRMNAEKRQIDFSEEEIREVLSPITRLPAYPDAEKGLSNLKNAGYHLVAFSNGKPSVLKEQLHFSGLEVFFDQVLSVEGAGKYKPHPEAYNYALKAARSKAAKAMMVAAHGWDIAGARRAGLQTAFIQRPGKQLFPLAEEPNIQASHIEDLAEKMTQ